MNPYWDEYEKPHFIDMESILDGLFKLHCVYLASSTYMGREAEEIDEFDEIAMNRFESEISKLLLSISISIRVYDEFVMNTDLSDQYHEKMKSMEEIFDIGVSIPYPEARAIRIACNRIIHAREVRPVYDNGDNPRDSGVSWGMTGSVELVGSFNESDWHETISISDFVNTCMGIVAFDRRIQEYPDSVVEYSD